MIDLFNIARTTDQSIDLRAYTEGSPGLMSSKTHFQYRIHMIAVVSIAVFDFFATGLEILEHPGALVLRKIECLQRFWLVLLKNNPDNTQLNRKIYNHNAATLLICITRLALGRFSILSYLLGFLECLYKVHWIIDRRTNLDGI